MDRPDRDVKRANQKLMRASMEAPMLARETEAELARRWREQGDEKALHELVRSYIRLVIATASRYRSYGLPVNDLIQEGNVGLMQAAMRFDPARDVRFSTYAVWWIRSTIQDFILRNWSIVRTATSASHKSLFFNLRRLRALIHRSSASETLTDEGRAWIAEQLKVDLATVSEMDMRLSTIDQSLSAPISDSSSSEFHETLCDDGPTPEQVIILYRDGAARSRWLNEAISQLSPREQSIISERHLSDDGVTLSQLGERFGVSKERVRQIEQRAMGVLRQALMKRVEHQADLLLGSPG